MISISPHLTIFKMWSIITLRGIHFPQIRFSKRLSIFALQFKIWIIWWQYSASYNLLYNIEDLYFLEIYVFKAWLIARYSYVVRSQVMVMMTIVTTMVRCRNVGILIIIRCWNVVILIPIRFWDVGILVEMAKAGAEKTSKEAFWEVRSELHSESEMRFY